MLPETIDIALLKVILIALFSFGCFYALLIYLVRKSMRRWSAFAVVVGVGITLLGLAALDSRWALLTLLLFAASGAPMVIGNIIKVELEENKERRDAKAAWEEKN